jgi:hypothetical protein
MIYNNLRCKNINICKLRVRRFKLVAAASVLLFGEKWARVANF